MVAQTDGTDFFAAANEVFHAAYGASRDASSDEVPVLIVIADELALHRRGTRQALPYSRPVFHRAKSAAHIAVALFTLSCPKSSAPSVRAQLLDLSAQLERITSAPASAPDSEPITTELRSLLETCAYFASRVHAQAPSDEVRADFARDAGTRILRLTDLATRIQVASLHEAVNQLLSCLSSLENGRLQVVVIGDHQARVRSLPMQYFQRRFGEAPGSDERVTYGENLTNEEEAIALVGTRRLDRTIAGAFFGDEKRLQRDVLGDAAKRCIDGMNFCH